MAEYSKSNINGVPYDLKDAKARADIAELDQRQTNTEGRLNGLTNVPEGSEGGSYPEIRAARVDGAGKTYGSLGDAMLAQVPKSDWASRFGRAIICPPDSAMVSFNTETKILTVPDMIYIADGVWKRFGSAQTVDLSGFTSSDIHIFIHKSDKTLLAVSYTNATALSSFDYTYFCSVRVKTGKNVYINLPFPYLVNGKIFGLIEENAANQASVSFGDSKIDLTKYVLINGTLEGGVLQKQRDARCATSEFIFIGNAVGFRVVPDAGYKFGIHFYSSPNESAFIKDIGGWVTEAKEISIPYGANYFRVVFANTSDDVIGTDRSYVTVTRHGLVYRDVVTTVMSQAKPRIHIGSDYFRLYSNNYNPYIVIPSGTTFVWSNTQIYGVDEDVTVPCISLGFTTGQALYLKKRADKANSRQVVTADDFIPVPWYEHKAPGTDFLYVCEMQHGVKAGNGGGLDIGVPWYYNDKLFGLFGEESDEPTAYSYTGEKVPSKVNGFNSKKVFTMTYPEGGSTSQDIEIFGDYMFVAFTGTECIQIYSLTSKTAVGVVYVDVSHGSGMQFSGEYYEDGDTFPLLYVGGWTDNKVNVIRITNTDGAWAATIVRTLVIPTENGYYPAPSVDAEHNVLYCYGYKQTHIQKQDNCMMLSKFDLNRLTDNGDGTYTPARLSVIEAPYLGVMQGRKYYQGRLYVGFSNTGSPHNSRLVVVDASTGDVKTDIDMTGVTTSENEGVCYQIDGNNIYWYYTDYYDVFKLTF